EVSMCLVRANGIIEIPETARNCFASMVFIIVFYVKGLAGPIAATLDAKMIVGSIGQRTSTPIGFQESLSQLYTRRNAGSLHFLNRHRSIKLNVQISMISCFKGKKAYKLKNDKSKQFGSSIHSSI